MTNSNTKVTSNTEFKTNNVFDILINILIDLKNSIFIAINNFIKNILN